MLFPSFITSPQIWFRLRTFSTSSTVSPIWLARLFTLSFFFFFHFLFFISLSIDVSCFECVHTKSPQKHRSKCNHYSYALKLIIQKFLNQITMKVERPTVDNRHLRIEENQMQRNRTKLSRIIIINQRSKLKTVIIIIIEQYYYYTCYDNVKCRMCHAP